MPGWPGARVRPIVGTGRKGAEPSSAASLRSDKATDAPAADCVEGVRVGTLLSGVWFAFISQTPSNAHERPRTPSPHELLSCADNRA